MGSGGGGHRNTAVQLVSQVERAPWYKALPGRSWWQSGCICWEPRLAFRELVSGFLEWEKSTRSVSEAGLRIPVVNSFLFLMPFFTTWSRSGKYLEKQAIRISRNKGSIQLIDK